MGINQSSLNQLLEEGERLINNILVLSGYNGSVEIILHQQAQPLGIPSPIFTPTPGGSSSRNSSVQLAHLLQLQGPSNPSVAQQAGMGQIISTPTGPEWRPEYEETLTEVWKDGGRELSGIMTFDFTGQARKLRNGVLELLSLHENKSKKPSWVLKSITPSTPGPTKFEVFYKVGDLNIMWNMPSELCTVLLGKLDTNGLVQKHNNLQSTYRCDNICMCLVTSRNKVNNTKRLHCQRGMFGDVQALLSTIVQFKECKDLMEAKSCHYVYM